jgi:DNA helicase-2/ATP-dependent DNA helicase PcrA
LLIDESQDTKKDLLEAFFRLQAEHGNHFLLGLFGDMMQRIYSDGKPDLGNNIPSFWAKPSKIINYRCPKRVIGLINKIRSVVDKIEQIPGEKNTDGVVRLFLVKQEPALDKTGKEEQICSQMAEICSDDEWENPHEVEILALEHKMLAKRGGFYDFFAPLYANDKLKIGLLNGNLTGLSLFADQILPLVRAHQKNDSFAIATVVKKYSPLLKREKLQRSASPNDELTKANCAVSSLCSLWDRETDPCLLSVLRNVFGSGLFEIPEKLKIIAKRPETVKTDTEDGIDPVINAWETALNAPFSQIEKYIAYRNGDSHFGTHQGIKGLQFQRVMVVLDDNDAGGFLFSFEKLLGAKDQSDTDRRNTAEGRESTIDRTRRLFYVTCSRAQKSLAIVSYTADVDRVKQFVVNNGWFDSNEIVEI